MSYIASGRVVFLQECIVDAYKRLLLIKGVGDNENLIKDIFIMSNTDEILKRKLK